MKKIAIVGAGLSGATIAFELVWRGGYEITIFESRDHIAGNVHTERDQETGVMLHKYGPHVFHTDNDRVWKFMRQFGEFGPYIQRTKGEHDGKVYSLPINLHTINQFYGFNFSPDEARAFVARRCHHWIVDPQNFEEQALRTVGPDLYEAFLKCYTVKQWGMHPTKVPASVLKRLPLRFDYNDNAFNHKFQGIPFAGYTPLVKNMIDHSRIKVALGFDFRRADVKNYDHVFYSGPIDKWFEHSQGRLPYRTLDFEVIRAEGDFQGCAVLNSCDLANKWTRSTEHKHFTPWEPRPNTVVYREHSRDCEYGDTPYYPIRFPKDKEQLLRYEAMAASEQNVTFVGRLGTYQYLDMDVTVERALRVATDFHRQSG